LTNYSHRNKNWKKIPRDRHVIVLHSAKDYVNKYCISFGDLCWMWRQIQMLQSVTELITAHIRTYISKVALIWNIVMYYHTTLHNNNNTVILQQELPYHLPKSYTWSLNNLHKRITTYVILSGSLVTASWVCWWRVSTYGNCGYTEHTITTRGSPPV
jgi:hypothetical protein